MKSLRTSEEIMRELEQKRRKKLGALAGDLLSFLLKGPVHANSGSVFSQEGEFKHLMTTTDMYEVVRLLGGFGIEVSRTDSGGNPTWEITGCQFKGKSA